MFLKCIETIKGQQIVACGYHILSTKKYAQRLGAMHEKDEDRCIINIQTLNKNIAEYFDFGRFFVFKKLIHGITRMNTILSVNMLTH